MEVLALVFIWPFLVLALGLTFIAFFDGGGFFGFLGGWLFWPILIIGLIVWSRARKAGENKSVAEQLTVVRKGAITLSISLLLPTFTRYLVQIFEASLPGIVMALVFGFALIVWGMFMQNRHVLMYSNVVGGAFSVFYAYSYLWDLGELPRIIAAGIGLAIAVVIAVMKLKDKLS